MNTTLTPIITSAGLKAVFNAQSTGLAATITEIALGDAAWTPNQTATALKNEKRRIPISGGERINDSQIHLTGVEDGTNLEYWVREIGFYLTDGTLLAVWSNAKQALAYKSASIDLLLAFDLVLSALPANSVTIDGTAGFSLPPATEHKRGIIRIATQAEITAGTATDVAVNPNQIKKLINNNPILSAPLHPELITANHRLSITQNNNTIFINDNQSLWTRHGIFNFNDYAVVNRTFHYNAANTYHLRWNEEKGFQWFDLSDHHYNPSQLDHKHPDFLSSFDDILLGGLVKGDFIASIITNHKKYFYQPVATGTILLPVGYSDNAIKITLQAYKTKGWLEIPDNFGHHVYIYQTLTNSGIETTNWTANYAYLTSSNHTNESTISTLNGLFSNGYFNYHVHQSEDGAEGQDKAEELFSQGRKLLTIKEQQYGIPLNHFNIANCSVYVEVM